MLKLYLTYTKLCCPVRQCEAMRWCNIHAEAEAQVLTVPRCPEQLGHLAQQHLGAVTPPATLQHCSLQPVSGQGWGFSCIVQRVPRSSQIFSSQWLLESCLGNSRMSSAKSVPGLECLQWELSLLVQHDEKFLRIAL